MQGGVRDSCAGCTPFFNPEEYHDICCLHFPSVPTLVRWSRANSSPNFAQHMLYSLHACCTRRRENIVPNAHTRIKGTFVGMQTGGLSLDGSWNLNWQGPRNDVTTILSNSTHIHRKLKLKQDLENLIWCSYLIWESWLNWWRHV